MMNRSVLAAAFLAFGMAVTVAAPAHAGILDGTLSNLQIIDHLSALDTNINSDPQTSENRNANIRADGTLNNASGQHS